VARSNPKGKRGEREAAQLTGGIRTWEHRHDLYAHDAWWEVKLEKTGYAKIYHAINEWVEHRKETGDGDIPRLLIRMDRKPWFVVFLYDDWSKGHANLDNSPQG
jgi:hypothetical protein